VPAADAILELMLSVNDTMHSIQRTVDQPAWSTFRKLDTAAVGISVLVGIYAGMYKAAVLGYEDK
jgi:hypothetical protein